jgi:hypothetical protein
VSAAELAERIRAIGRLPKGRPGRNTLKRMRNEFIAEWHRAVHREAKERAATQGEKR